MHVEEQLLPTAFARAANVDSTFAYMGSLMTFLAKGSETSGRFALMECHTKPGNEPPPHVHEREHELYFLLEGTMRFYCEDKVLRFFGECSPKKWPLWGSFGRGVAVTAQNG